MGSRGRASSAALALSSPSPIEVVERQRPPHDLTDEEVEVWAAVVGAEPAEWFTPSTAPLLAQYCRHVVHAKRVAELIERATSDPDLPIELYERLLKMQARESNTVAMLATKMRLAQQSTYDKSKRKPLALNKPWSG